MTCDKEKSVYISVYYGNYCVYVMGVAVQCVLF